MKFKLILLFGISFASCKAVHQNSIESSPEASSKTSSENPGLGLTIETLAQEALEKFANNAEAKRSWETPLIEGVHDNHHYTEWKFNGTEEIPSVHLRRYDSAKGSENRYQVLTTRPSKEGEWEYQTYYRNLTDGELVRVLVENRVSFQISQVDSKEIFKDANNFKNQGYFVKGPSTKIRESEVWMNAVLRNVEGVVPIHAIEYSEEKEIGLLVMEKAEMDVDQILKKEKFEKEDFTKFSIQASKAILNMHKLNIMHGDIKPSNFLKLQNGHYVTADFGNSKFFGKTALIGTEDYVPNWVHSDEFEANPQFDVFALGLTLGQTYVKGVLHEDFSYFFHGIENLRKLLDQNSQDPIATLILKMTSEHRNQLPTMEEVVATLEK